MQTTNQQYDEKKKCRKHATQEVIRIMQRKTSATTRSQRERERDVIEEATPTKYNTNTKRKKWSLRTAERARAHTQHTAHTWDIAVYRWMAGCWLCSIQLFSCGMRMWLCLCVWVATCTSATLFHNRNEWSSKIRTRPWSRRVHRENNDVEIKETAHKTHASNNNNNKVKKKMNRKCWYRRIERKNLIALYVLGCVWLNVSLAMVFVPTARQVPH